MQEICPLAEEWELMRELSYLDVDVDVLWRPFETLSNGEQTKVLIAALFLNEGHFLVLRTFARTLLTWITIRNLGLSLIFMNGLIYYLALLTTMQVDMLTKIRNGQSLQDFFLLLRRGSI